MAHEHWQPAGDGRTGYDQQAGGLGRLYRRLAAPALTAAAVRLGFDRPELVTVAVPAPSLPPALAGLRIGHLTDLHAGPVVREASLARAARLLQTAAPDLIAITGDLVDAWPEDAPAAARALAGLSAPLGVWACLGNHDHRPGAAVVRAALAEHAPQIRLLVNEARPARDDLWVAGLDSACLGRADPARALAAVPPDAPCLLLSHEPDPVADLPRPVLLALAGHTHGGQAYVAGRPLFLPPLGQRFTRGLYATVAGPLYVGRGVGCTRLPLRINSPPEVTVLELTAAAPARG